MQHEPTVPHKSHETTDRTRYPDYYLQPGGRPPSARHSHLLVPCGMRDSDHKAISLGAEIASLHRARLTVCHVSPILDDGPSFHWLDAIDRLHRTLVPRPPAFTPQTMTAHGNLSVQLCHFVNSHIPVDARSSLNLRITTLTGEIANSVARYANDSDVDLVVMSCNLARWWWQSVLPVTVQRVMQLTTKQVLLVRPEA